jgi:hypothetical protein
MLYSSAASTAPQKRRNPYLGHCHKEFVRRSRKEFEAELVVRRTPVVYFPYIDFKFNSEACWGFGGHWHDPLRKLSKMIDSALNTEVEKWDLLEQLTASYDERWSCCIGASLRVECSLATLRLSNPRISDSMQRGVADG